MTNETDDRTKMGYDSGARFEHQVEEATEKVLPDTPVDQTTVEITRVILLVTLCPGAKSCCGGGGVDKPKYAIVTIKGNAKTGWKLIEASRQTGNIMSLAQEYKKNLWKGTVHGMGLHEDIDFMAQLRDRYPKHVKDGCQVIPC